MKMGKSQASNKLKKVRHYPKKKFASSTYYTNTKHAVYTSNTKQHNYNKLHIFTYVFYKKKNKNVSYRRGSHSTPLTHIIDKNRFIVIYSIIIIIIM